MSGGKGRRRRCKRLIISVRASATLPPLPTRVSDSICTVISISSGGCPVNESMARLGPALPGICTTSTDMAGAPITRQYSVRKRFGSFICEFLFAAAELVVL